MKYRFEKFALALTLILPIISCQNKTKVKSFKTEDVQKLDAYIASIPERLPVPGVMAVVIKDDQTYKKVSGLTTVKDGVPLTDSSLFFTGNLSELMVATLIMKMAEEGKFKLDDPVHTRLPSFRLGDSTYKKITIRHLLTHTSGVRYHNASWDIPYQGKDALSVTTQSVRFQLPDFPAGTRVKRNPYNFDILANLIEEVSRKPFEEYMHETVFRPLGMGASAYRIEQIDRVSTAKPHHISNWLNYQVEMIQDYPQNRENAGSIGLHSSARDLSIWLNMLLHKGKVGSKRFLSSASVEELLGAQVKTGPDKFVGLGFDIEAYSDHTVLTKTHDLGGFSASLQIIPEEKIAVVVIVNVNEEFNPGAISTKLLRWVKSNNGLAPERTPVQIPMGQKYVTTNQLDSAFALYAQLKKNKQNDYDYSIEALSQFGFNLFYRMDRKTDAIKAYEFAKRCFPQSAYANLNLAEAYLINQDSSNARKFLKEAQVLPANQLEIQNRIAYVQQTLGKD